MKPGGGTSDFAVIGARSQGKNCSNVVASNALNRPLLRRALAGLLPLLGICGAAQAQQPIQWTGASGGNGHWYKLVTVANDLAWSAAETAAREAGGALATITSKQEQEWIQATFASGQSGCSASGAPARLMWIGLRQDPKSEGFAEPDGGWTWIDGEPLDFANWAAGEPDDGNLGVGHAGMRLDGSWEDVAQNAGCFRSYLIEWSADCNGDGIVDLGQIMGGELDDANANGVADCCESSDVPTEDCNLNGVLDACELTKAAVDSDGDWVLDSCERAFGDLDLDGEVGPLDLAMLLSIWATVEPLYGDFDDDGVIGATDLAFLLSKWGSTPPWLLPSIASVSPASGPLAGGTSITIRGWNLVGASAVSIGGVPAASMTALDENTVLATTPAGSAGAAAISVSTPLGSATLPSGFTYLAAPAILSVSPNSGPASGGTTITIVGSNLAGVKSVNVGGNVATGVTVVNPTTVRAVTPSGAIGAAGVTISTAGGVATLAGGFTYAAAPTIASVSPNFGPFSGGTQLTITGTNLTGATSVMIGSNPATSVNVVDATTIRATSPAGAAGVVNLSVSTPGGRANLASGFTYVGAPAITAVAPSSGPLAGGTVITITGSNLAGTTSVTVGGVAATSVVATSPTSVSAVAPAGTAGEAAVAVTTPSGTATLPSAYRYVAVPSVTSITPNASPASGGATITIVGADLSTTTSVSVGGAPATGVTVVDDRTVTAVTPAGSLGAKSVALTTSGGTAQVANAITYFSDLPWATILDGFPDPSVVTSSELRDAIVATGLPWRVRDNATGIELLLVPAGSFSMGCSASTQGGCGSDENPVHEVTLTNPVYVGRYEVTQSEWAARMGSNPSHFQGANYPDAASRPVEKISWTAVQGFLAGSGLRLPTEAEWEYAYRAGTTTAYHSMPGHPAGTNDGNLIGAIAWYSVNAGGQTRSVGAKAPNALGLHDMSGNVWEWVGDWYSATYYASSPVADPLGPASGSTRVMRGGSWSANPSGHVRSSDRNSSTPGSSSNFIGFRVARNP